MKTKTTLLTTLSLILVASSLRAEFRVWTDANGKSVKAEHVINMADKVVLRLTDGREIKVPLGSLSESDRLLATVLQPPKLEIEVSPISSRSNQSLRSAGPGSGIQVQEESVTVKVDVRKVGSVPYDARLRAELYVLGEQENGLVVIDQITSIFSFPSAKSEVHSFSSAPVKVSKLEGARRGTEYDGYLLVIFNSRGDVVEVKGSRQEYHNKYQSILATGKGSALDEEYNQVPVRRRDSGYFSMQPRLSDRNF